MGWNPIRDAVESVGSLAGNYFLPGSSLLTDNLVSKGSQSQLSSPLGQLAQAGTGLAGSGALGAGLQSVGGAAEQQGLNSLLSGVKGGLSSIADSTGLSNLYNGGSDIGSASGAGTNLAEFNPSSGYSTFLGGTAAPDSVQSDFYQGFANTPGSADVAGSATTPGIGSAINASPVSSTVAAGGGGNLAGFGENLGNDFSSGLSSTAVGQSGGTLGSIGNNDFAAFNTTSPVSNLDTGALNSFTQNSGDVLNGQANPLAGIGGQQGGSGLSNLYNSAIGTPNVPAGSFNYDINGNAAGLAAQPISQQFQTGGGNVGLLGSLFGGGSSAPASTGGHNVLNGLLKGGLGYLLNSKTSNDGVANATQQAQANFSPYLQAGNQAEGTLANLYGNNGSSAQAAAEQNFQNSPGYQFALNQGLNAVNADAAAKGNPLSGNTEQAVNNYAQGAASQQYNNYINQLQNLASGGLTAAGASGTAGLTGATAAQQQSQNNANARNTAVGTGLSALFPSGINLQQLLGGTNSQGLLSLFG